jgi:hypothetical protein
VAAIARVRASLRVFGDGLEPDEVSALLGHEPTRCHRKGDKLGSHHGARQGGHPGGHSSGSSSGHAGHGTAVEPTGAWILDSRISEKAEIEDHVESILALLTSDYDEWASLTERFSASILCGVFLDQYNEGFELSPRLCKALANRGLVIAFDIYSGDPDA